MCSYDWGCKKIWKSNSFRISYDGMLLQAGFVNKEIIIKEQHNCRSTDYWETQNNNFLLLAHEYIFVFRSKIIHKE